MIKYLLIAGVVVLCLAGLFLLYRFISLKFYAPPENIELVDSFEGGTLSRVGSINVLRLEGNYREMGRQYGKLLNAEINAAYEALVSRFLVQEMKMDEKALKDLAARLFEFYPERIKEIVYGMAETSTLEAGDIVTLNAFYDAVKETDAPGCAIVSSWGGYSEEKRSVVGRNFDIGREFRDLNNLMALVVFVPNDGSRSAAIFTYSGMISTPQAFNDAGIAIFNNNVTNAGAVKNTVKAFSPMTAGLPLVLDNSSFTATDSALRSLRSSGPVIFGLADHKEALMLELSDKGGIPVPFDDDGLAIAVNHLRAETSVVTSDPTRSSERLANMLAIAKKNKGRISADVMSRMLDVKIDDKGARTMDTVYQIVYVPEYLALWIKEVGRQDWTRIDLSVFFKRRGNA